MAVAVLVGVAMLVFLVSLLGLRVGAEVSHVCSDDRRPKARVRAVPVDPLPGRSGHDITASREYWRVTVPANSQTD